MARDMDEAVKHSPMVIRMTESTKKMRNKVKDTCSTRMVAHILANGVKVNHKVQAISKLKKAKFIKALSRMGSAAAKEKNSLQTEMSTLARSKMT